jgi:hypothetical protein
MTTETMSSRERVLAALRGDDVDRVPWSPCIDGYFLGKMDQVDGFRRLGADAMLRHYFNYLGSVPFRLSVAPPGKTMPWTKTERAVGAEQEVIYHTPVGELVERFCYNPESPNIPWTTRRRVRTVEDMKVLTWMCERAEFAPLPILFEQGEKRIGDDGVTTISILGTPLFWILNSEADVDTFWFLYFDHPAEMEALFEAAHQMLRRMCMACAEGPGEVVIQYENLSSSLCSPAIWEKYAPRWINEYADILHAGGKTFLMHACGHLLAFGARLAGLSLDGFVDIATPPTGTLPTLARARELWGPDKFIMGGLDATAQVGLEGDAFKAYIRAVLRNMSDGRRMALGTNDAVPKNATWENLMAVAEVVREEGKFPLRR